MTTVTIYNMNGTVVNTISNPVGWAFDERGDFVVTFTTASGQTEIRTTLPVLVERTS